MTVELPDPAEWPVLVQVLAGLAVWYVLAAAAIRPLQRHTDVFDGHRHGSDPFGKNSAAFTWIFSPLVVPVFGAALGLWAVAWPLSLGLVAPPWKVIEVKRRRL